MPWERRVNINHQISAQAEFFQGHRVEPFRERIHPQRFPVLWQGVFQPGNGDIIQHQRFTVTQPVAGRADHAAFPAGSELTQRDPLRGEFRIQNRVEKMQRTVNEFAGVHR